jgi:AcrR family transcriptional regulator
MRLELGLSSQGGVLTPSVPIDIGIRTQRQRIVEAMANSCAEKTFSTTTIADVVSRASISRATFYKHFANKRECLNAAVASFIEDIEEVAAEAKAGAASQPEAIWEAVAAVLGLLATKPAYAKVVMIEMPVLDPSIAVHHRALVIEAFEEQWHSGNGHKRTGADEQMAVGRAHVLVADYLAAGQAERLPELLPEIVYILLLPFVGHRKALAQVELAQ